MGKAIEGRRIAEKINADTKKHIAELGASPRLAIVLASKDESSHKYVEMKMRKVESVGMEARLYHFDEQTTQGELIHEIRRFRNNEAVHGVLIQVPFYDHLYPHTNEIINALEPQKDADGLTAVQLGKSSHLLPEAVPTAAVEAILESLNDCFEQDLTWKGITENKSDAIEALKGKEVVIINNTNLIGKPLANILMSLEASVVVLNRNSSNVPGTVNHADIVISATNQTHLFTHEHIKEEAILIDVTSTLRDGKVLGDFVYDSALINKCSFYTPVPGGIGPLTIACLMRNVVRLALMD